MKLHPNVVTGILECLELIFRGNKHTDDVLDKSFKAHRQWGARDRRFIAESTYEIVRWWRLLLHASETVPEDEHVFRKVFVAYLVKAGIEVPDYLLPEGASIENVRNLIESPSGERKIVEAIPDWLDELGESELGTAIWAKELKSLNRPASVFLRVNTLKTNSFRLVSLLAEKQIDCQLLDEATLLLSKRQNLASLEEYKAGLFEVQDIGSQKIAPFLHVKEGHRVIDACAGGGGKTLHLAALMQNKGEIIAMDIENKKLSNLEERTKRAGASMVKTFLVDDNVLHRYKDYADKLLLDVPCSGLGVLKRNPDAKWKLTKAEVERIKNVQKQILESYPSMLKAGGEFVYATCSILPSENQEQVLHFIHNQKGRYELLEEKAIWPSEGGDGYYMARIRKNPQIIG